MFAQQIDKMFEVYMDDMLVKSLYTINHLTYLTKMFNVLYINNMKLNPNKCTFEVSSWKCMGFMVNQRVIKVNPNKVKSNVGNKAPQTMKEVQ